MLTIYTDIDLYDNTLIEQSNNLLKGAIQIVPHQLIKPSYIVCIIQLRYGHL